MHALGLIMILGRRDYAVIGVCCLTDSDMVKSSYHVISPLLWSVLVVLPVLTWWTRYYDISRLQWSMPVNYSVIKCQNHHYVYTRPSQWLVPVNGTMKWSNCNCGRAWHNVRLSTGTTKTLTSARRRLFDTNLQTSTQEPTSGSTSEVSFKFFYSEFLSIISRLYNFLLK